MLRAKSWIVSPLALALVLVVAVRPEARTRDVQGVLSSAPVAPEVLLLEGCTTVGQREEYERQDCLQSTRIALMNGEIGLAEALARLEACANERADLASFARRSARLRADLLRARLAFGETLLPEEQQEYAEFAERYEGLDAPPPAGSVRRLRAAGITTGRIAEDREEEILRRLRDDSALRADFRAVFGDLRAEDLDRLLDETPERTATAVVLGATTIIPNLLPASPTPEGTLAVEAEPVARALIVSTDAYTARFVSDLRALELARLQYLTSAGLLNQQKGSVREFLQRLRNFGDDEGREEDLRAAMRRDQAVLAARLMNLDRRLGLDPLLARMAGESVGLGMQISQTCEAVAANRQRWIHIGTGVVTGLVGAAGVVIATGATGTMIGGVTIAAALEASIAAYLIAKTERIGEAIASSAPPARIIEELRAEFRTFERPESEVGVTDEGEEGEGGSSEDTWIEEFDEARELAFVEGEGGEEEERSGGEEAAAEMRENTIPPILPIDIPEELRELPPFLDAREIRALRELSLPEIQQRLDEFLVGSDPTAWARLVEEEDVDLWSTAMMIQEAQAALNLWENYRQLSDRFGTFFIQAELERLPAARRSQVLTQAMGRYLQDRAFYENSRDITDLRRRIASRLVTHCRSGASQGDLVLAACVDETALTLLVVAAIRDAKLPVPAGSTLGVQAFENRFEAVLYSRSENRVYSLTRGEETEGVVAPIYHPAIFYYGYLVDHQVVPTIDIDEHLLVALPDRPMPPEMELEECVIEEGRGVLDRAVEWIGSMFGIRKVSNDPCMDGDDERARRSGGGGGGGVNLSLPTPRNPLQRGGGGQAGGGGGAGGGNGSSSPLAPNSPGDPLSGGGSSGLSTESGGQGGQGDSGQGEQGASAGDAGGNAGGSGGAGDGGATEEGADRADGRGGQQPGGSDNATAGTQPTRSGGDGSGAGGETATSGSGGDGGYGIGTSLPAGPSLTRIGRETARMSERYAQAPDLRVVPWRLREDQGMATGSPSAVLYADNARALERFNEDDLFITLAPAEVEAQRRMLEADSYPIYPAEATCQTANLPPRRVFRRAAANEAGFRYVFCDHDESMVIFREQKDAQSYARLSAPDRPLFLARLASERLARFERSEDIARLQAFLSDPNVLRDYSRDQIAATVKAAADLIVFQDALESALVQSMNEIGPSAIRSHYYEMHRQVFQAPFFLDIAEKVYRLNQRLASDPLQSLAWANAQEPRVRQGFFELYYTVGAIMDWPRRWATLQSRYGDSEPPPIEPASGAQTSLDFLQILSDPTRVRIAWETERDGSPSIRDTQAMEGVERSPMERDRPTQSDKLDKQDEEKHLRGGTDGLGRAGTGDSRGPDSGRRPPLQMIRIRITPDAEGDPRGEDLPRANQLRPGGTEGRERRQTEESASRQDPVLWVTPQTFVEAVLSTWDSRDLRPESADRVPPLLRFNERLREVFLREFQPSNGIYDNRLRAAMEIFTRSGWLRYGEVREVMGGPLVKVRAFDAGRFSGAYSGNAPINDQDQIRIPNFFSQEGVIIPADLFRPVREHYTRAVLGIFDLAADQGVPSAESLARLPLPPGEEAAAARANLLRNLELILQEADGD